MARHTRTPAADISAPVRASRSARMQAIWAAAACMLTCASANLAAQPISAAPAPSTLSAQSAPGEIGEVHRLYYAGQTKAALEKADAYLAGKANDAQMRFIKGVMLADLRRNAEAIVIFRKLVDDFPDLAEPYNNLAALYAAAGDYDRARATLEQAVRANPAYAIAQENLGDIYAVLASEAYARAKQLDPNNASVEPKLVLVRELFKRIPPAAPGASGAAAAASAAR